MGIVQADDPDALNFFSDLDASIEGTAINVDDMQSVERVMTLLDGGQAPRKRCLCVDSNNNTINVGKSVAVS